MAVPVVGEEGSRQPGKLPGFRADGGDGVQAAGAGEVGQVAHGEAAGIGRGGAGGLLRLIGPALERST